MKCLPRVNQVVDLPLKFISRISQGKRGRNDVSKSPSMRWQDEIFDLSQLNLFKKFA